MVVNVSAQRTDCLGKLCVRRWASLMNPRLTNDSYYLAGHVYLGCGWHVNATLGAGHISEKGSSNAVDTGP